jgi:hypothetical protein
VTSLADDVAGTLAVDVSRRASQAITLATAICEAEGTPLNELQLAALIQATISCMDGLEAALAHLLSADAGLRTGRMGVLLRGDDGPL